MSPARLGVVLSRGGAAEERAVSPARRRLALAVRRPRAGLDSRSSP